MKMRLDVWRGRTWNIFEIFKRVLWEEVRMPASRRNVCVSEQMLDCIGETPRLSKS